VTFSRTSLPSRAVLRMHKFGVGSVSVPPTQTSIEQGSWIEYHPITSVLEGTPIEFDVNGSGEDYIDFANTLLYVKAKLVTMTDNNLAADAAGGPANLLLYSLFSQVDISLNGTMITVSTNTCPHRAMLETLLSYGEDAKKSQLTSALFYKHQAGTMDSINFGDNALFETTGWLNVDRLSERVASST